MLCLKETLFTFCQYHIPYQCTNNSIPASLTILESSWRQVPCLHQRMPMLNRIFILNCLSWSSELFTIGDEGALRPILSWEAMHNPYKRKRVEFPVHYKSKLKMSWTNCGNKSLITLLEFTETISQLSISLNDELIYEINHQVSCDPRSYESNFCNCVYRSLKKSGLAQGLNPWPLDTGATL